MTALTQNQQNLNDIFFQSKTTGVDYHALLQELQKYLSDHHAKAISGEGSDAPALMKNIIKQYLIKQRYSVDGFTTEQLVDRLYEDMAGYSFLRKWIYMDGVEEVNINAYNDIEVIMSGGKSMKIPEKFASPTQAIDVMRRMLTSCGMVIDDTMPSVLGHIDKNIRISVDKTPLVDADVGVNASIRIVNQQSVTEDKLLKSGSATREMLDFLTACVRYGVSVCIAGATGSGKTTIMAWLLSTVPDNRRLITIEDGSREFNLVKKDADGNIQNSVCHLLTRPNENPELDIDQDFLLERVLRKHPNVIGVGEIRAAAECMSVAEASRTGHTCLTTIHSNSAESSYKRMMTLAKRKFQMADDILLQIMVEAFPIIVYTKQLDDGSRKIMEIIEGEDFVKGKTVTRTLFRYDVLDNTVDADGNVKITGRHTQCSDISDTLRKRMMENGISARELSAFTMKKEDAHDMD